MEPTGNLLQVWKRLQEFNQARDWQQYHNPRNLAMALSVEANELLELFLWSSDEGPQPPVEGRKPKVEEEVADVLICLLNFCSQSGIDLLEVTNRKMDKNESKYPVDRSKGKLEKHSEL